MVADEGEAAKHWARWRGPSGQGLVTGTGYPDTWSRDAERAVEDGPQRRRQLLADRLGRSHLPHHGVRRRAPAVAARVSPDGWLASCGKRSHPRADRARAATTRTGTRRRRRRPMGSASTSHSARAACLQSTWTASSCGIATSVRWRRITDPPARRCSTRTGSSSIRTSSPDRSSPPSTRARARTLWRTKRDGNVGWGTPIAIRVADHDEIIVNGQQRVQAYNPDTGAELWSCGGTSFEVIPTPVVGHGLVFCSSGRAGPTLAIRPGGKGDVTSSHLAWTSPRGSPFVPSPMLYGDYLYMVNDMAEHRHLLRGEHGKDHVARTPRRGAAGRILRIAGRVRRQGVLHQRRGRDVRAEGRADLSSCCT